MNAIATGELEYCDATGCHTFFNTFDCASITATIDLETGKTCETCVNGLGQVKYYRCDDTFVGCTLIVAPEPDCVVCAIPEGAVVYSSCVPQKPECVYGKDTTTGCRECYDSSGRLVLNECGVDCTTVSCPPVVCEAGYEWVVPPNGCCPICLPKAEACNAEICLHSGYEVPDCPVGTVLRRDPVDCCYYFCAPDGCPGPTTTPIDCPAGFYWEDQIYPQCGQCVPMSAAKVGCLVTANCSPGEYCTTENGDCIKDPTCGTAACACAGECRPRSDQSSLCAVPVASDYFIKDCQGDWRSDGVGADGCPLPLTCHCLGGIVTLDGGCGDPCGSVACVNTPQCASGSDLVTNHPAYCCGVCVTPGTCLECPDLQCSAGFEPATDDCCTCVRSLTSCEVDSDCLPGERCEANNAGATTATCRPSYSCSDTDLGIDTQAAGYVVVRRDGGATETYQDHCESDGWTLIEWWCYSPYPSSPWRKAAYSKLTCANGCTGGACN